MSLKESEEKKYHQMMGCEEQLMALQTSLAEEERETMMKFELFSIYNVF